MNTRQQIVILAMSLGLVGCGEKQDGGDIAETARNYKSLQLMTPEPVLVGLELATLCTSVSKEMIEAERNDAGPHAFCRIEVYMNQLAADALRQNTAYPVGAVVVKEKQLQEILPFTTAEGDGVNGGVGGMIKRDTGFDPEHGDWEYFYFESRDTIDSGRIVSCVNCHSKAAGTDYVFGSWQDAGHGDEADE